MFHFRILNRVDDPLKFILLCAFISTTSTHSLPLYALQSIRLKIRFSKHLRTNHKRPRRRIWTFFYTACIRLVEVNIYVLNWLYNVADLLSLVGTLSGSACRIKHNTCEQAIYDVCCEFRHFRFASASKWNVWYKVNHQRQTNAHIIYNITAFGHMNGIRKKIECRNAVAETS